MAEYIEREAAINKRRRVTEYDEAGFSVTYSGVPVEEIEKIPAADVAPVVHGEWDAIPNTYMSVSSKDGSYSGNATSCSVCHEVNPNAYKTNYCPNCGAKMDGGKHV